MWTDVVAPIMTWLESGDPRDLLASPAAAALAFIIPSTIIALGIGVAEWRETPLAAWLGMSHVGDDSEDNWTERARDLDKDGSPDF
jgi:hypothetical protein